MSQLCITIFPFPSLCPSYCLMHEEHVVELQTLIQQQETETYRYIFLKISSFVICVPGGWGIQRITIQFNTLMFFMFLRLFYRCDKIKLEGKKWCGSVPWKVQITNGLSVTSDIFCKAVLHICQFN